MLHAIRVYEAENGNLTINMEDQIITLKIDSAGSLGSEGITPAVLAICSATNISKTLLQKILATRNRNHL